MKILAHKDLDISLEDAFAYMRNEKPLPYDVVLNLIGDSAVFETMDSCNLLGEIKEDYYIVYFEEE